MQGSRILDSELIFSFSKLIINLARIGEEAGFKFHDLIVWDQNAQRSLILLGYPSVFYTNQNCSFIVVFRKTNV